MNNSSTKRTHIMENGPATNNDEWTTVSKKLKNKKVIFETEKSNFPKKIVTINEKNNKGNNNNKENVLPKRQIPYKEEATTVVYEPKLKTRMCKFGKNCRRSTCYFAHNENELVVIECRFGTKCKNANCSFKHSEKMVEETPIIEEIIEEPPKIDCKDLFPYLSTDDNKEKNVIENEKSILSYKDIKTIVHGIKQITIKEKSIEDIIKEYNQFPDVTKITIEL